MPSPQRRSSHHKSDDEFIESNETMQAQKMCASCKHSKPMADFDGRATCNICRPIKRQKSQAYRLKRSAEKSTCSFEPKLASTPLADTALDKEIQDLRDAVGTAGDPCMQIKSTESGKVPRSA